MKAGTSVSVTFHLTDRDLSIWNVVKDSSNCSSGAFEQDVDYFNQDQQTRVGWVGSVDECCALCARTDTCNAYTLFEGTCWMKATANDRRGKSGAQSGVCKKESGSSHWLPVCGDFDVMIGASSEDIRLTGKLSNSMVVTV